MHCSEVDIYFSVLNGLCVLGSSDIYEFMCLTDVLIYFQRMMRHLSIIALSPPSNLMRYKYHKSVLNGVNFVI